MCQCSLGRRSAERERELAYRPRRSGNTLFLYSERIRERPENFVLKRMFRLAFVVVSEGCYPVSNDTHHHNPHKDLHTPPPPGNAAGPCESLLCGVRSRTFRSIYHFSVRPEANHTKWVYYIQPSISTHTRLWNTSVDRRELSVLCRLKKNQYDICDARSYVYTKDVCIVLFDILYILYAIQIFSS